LGKIQNNYIEAKVTRWSTINCEINARRKSGVLNTEPMLLVFIQDLDTFFYRWEILVHYAT